MAVMKEYYADEDVVMSRFSAEDHPARIVVETGARLHLGFYGLCRSFNRVFGGIGLAVDGIGFIIEAVFTHSEGISVSGCQSERALRIALEAARKLGLKANVEINVRKCVPQHVGLGSTTQLTLSIYTALGVPQGLTPRQLAEMAGRGPFSGVGTGVFLYGGLIIDSGVKEGSSLARPVFHAYVPEEWHIVAVLPKAKGWRVAEDRLEYSLMLRARLSRELCLQCMEAVLRLIGPGLAERDFESFTKGLEVLESLTAKAFSMTQGGAFCCSEALEAAMMLKKLGGKGVGQSSWGPLVYAFFKSKVHALKVVRELNDNGFKAFPLKPRNKGAKIRVFLG